MSISRKPRTRRWTGAATIVLLCTTMPASPLRAIDTPGVQPVQIASGGRIADRCAMLAGEMQADSGVAFTVTSVVTRQDGLVVDLGLRGKSPPLPAHCELYGSMQSRIGADGRHYAIGFHMRLPDRWNHRFLFEGGGGSDGDIGDASGPVGEGVAPALAQGFAVVSQDSGHDNRLNDDPQRGGVLSFGFDPQARTNYGHASLKPVYDAAQAVIRHYYGEKPRFNYFFGCSKGGQEGMAFAQRYPSAFDGIVAVAPGLSLPRAALQEAWDTQSFASIVDKAGTGPLAVSDLARSFSDADLGLVRNAVLAACDTLDGAKDGMIGDFGRCTRQRVVPQLVSRLCKGAKADGCLSSLQVAALERAIGGARDSRGTMLYASFPWDSGIGAPGWRLWKIGIVGGPPALNVVLGAGSLASVFSTPPIVLPPDPQALLDFQMAFNFDRDGSAIYRTTPLFRQSTWQDIGMRSPDLSAFRNRGGKMIIPQGVSDPVFSINDTIGWWNEVNRLNAGGADRFVRIFPVPGMNHCMGGAATDRFDALTAVSDWVEHRTAPASIIAHAGQQSPWPGRSRPLCPYPTVARYAGGDLEQAKSFRCSPPERVASSAAI